MCLVEQPGSLFVPAEQRGRVDSREDGTRAKSRRAQGGRRRGRCRQMRPLPTCGTSGLTISLLLPYVRGIGGSTELDQGKREGARTHTFAAEGAQQSPPTLRAWPDPAIVLPRQRASETTAPRNPKHETFGRRPDLWVLRGAAPREYPRPPCVQTAWFRVCAVGRCGDGEARPHCSDAGLREGRARMTSAVGNRAPHGRSRPRFPRRVAALPTTVR